MMKRDEELWVKKMKELLKDYSGQPAPGGWSKLEQDLPPVAVRRIRPYIRVAAAAAILLMISGISLFFMRTPVADDIRSTSTPVLAVAPDVIPKSKEPESLTAHINKIVMAKQETGPVITEVFTKTNDDPVRTDIPEKKDNTGATEQENKTKATSRDRVVTKPSKQDKLHLPVIDNTKTGSKGKWALSASISNGSGISLPQAENYPETAASPSPSFNDPIKGGFPNDSYGLIPLDNDDAYIEEPMLITDVKHKQPISFGLSVRRNLGNGFSVESGVTYTLLSSEGKSIIKMEDIEQKLHYIGIPVRGNWNFVETKQFTAYATAGGMIEKCVYGKTGSVKHTVKPLQFSLLGGIGAQVNVSNHIGLYIEPGVSYFFDDGSDVETIRKEKPLNFNLQGGIRFSY